MTSDAGVTNDTVSLYFGNGAFLYMQGGYYLYDAGEKMHANDTGDIRMILLGLGSGIVRHNRTNVVSAGSDHRFNVTADWEVFSYDVISDATTGKVHSSLYNSLDRFFSGFAGVTMAGSPSAGGLEDHVLLLQLTSPQIRIYWSGTTHLGGVIEIVSG